MSKICKYFLSQTSNYELANLLHGVGGWMVARQQRYGGYWPLWTQTKWTERNLIWRIRWIRYLDRSKIGDADTMALGIILFMYELPVGRRQNQRICRFLFVFRKAPVLEFYLSRMEFARNVQNTSTKRESRRSVWSTYFFRFLVRDPAW